MVMVVVVVAPAPAPAVVVVVVVVVHCSSGSSSSNNSRSTEVVSSLLWCEFTVSFAPISTAQVQSWNKRVTNLRRELDDTLADINRY